MLSGLNTPNTALTNKGTIIFFKLNTLLVEFGVTVREKRF